MGDRRPGTVKTVCPCCDILMGSAMRHSGPREDLIHYKVCDVCEGKDEPQRVIDLATKAIDMFDNPGTPWTLDSLAAAMSVTARGYKVRMAQLRDRR